MQYKKGDMVRGTRCKWGGRGIHTACQAIIPDYEYDGVRLKTCCCPLHGAFWAIAYTHKEIEHIFRFKSGDGKYNFPLEFHQFVICILEGEKGCGVEEIAHKLGGQHFKPLVEAVFRHPVTQARHPDAYKHMGHLKDLLSNMSAEDIRMIRSNYEDRDAKKVYAQRAWGATPREIDEILSKDYEIKEQAKPTPKPLECARMAIINRKQIVLTDATGKEIYITLQEELGA